jgi:hypothetical protein
MRRKRTGSKRRQRFAEEEAGVSLNEKLPLLPILLGCQSRGTHTSALCWFQAAMCRPTFFLCILSIKVHGEVKQNKQASPQRARVGGFSI